jgi:hypothetical protein
MPQEQTMITRRHLIHASLAGFAGMAACSTGQVSEPAAAPPTETKAASTTASAEPPRFDPADLKRRLDGGEDVYLLDVRTPKELEEEGAIDGYHHIPIDELEARVSEVPKGKPMVIY